MIEKIVLDYLSETLEYPVYMEEPDDKPERYYLLEKTGGGARNHIYTATMAIQSYAERMVYAAQMNETLKTAMEDIIALDDIGSCRLNSDYNFTDTTTKRYRYQAVYDLVHY